MLNFLMLILRLRKEKTLKILLLHMIRLMVMLMTRLRRKGLNSPLRLLWKNQLLDLALKE